MTSTKYIGMDVHKESISIAVINSVGKVVMECVIETKASTIVEFIDGLRGDLRVTLEEGTWAAWLYDLLKRHVTGVAVSLPFIGLFRLTGVEALLRGKFCVATTMDASQEYLSRNTA
jgi:hypothetical protein